MKSLTIHNMDDELAKAIKNLADSSGLSQNRVIKKLLREALNLSGENKPRQDFTEFCGIWTATEEKEFNQAVSDFEQVDEEMWT